MQQLQYATNPSATADRCAREVMDVVPLVMRHLRGWMRSERAAGLSVPQFRTLALLGRLGGSPLTAVAEHLGLSAASVSRMVQGLVTKGLVVREPGTSDRRQVSLRLSDRGRSVMNAARRRTEMHLAEVLSSLSAEQRAEVSAAAALLRDAFGPANPAGE